MIIHRSSVIALSKILEEYEKRKWKEFADSDKFIDMIINQIEDCEYCGDGIPKDGMAEHLSWCKPMIEGNKKKKESDF